MTAPPPETYCHAARGHEHHGPYHDLEYGFPLRARIAELNPPWMR